MLGIAAQPNTAQMVNRPPLRDRTHEQFVDEPVDHDRPAIDRERAIPGAVGPPRPDPMAIRLLVDERPEAGLKRHTAEKPELDRQRVAVLTPSLPVLFTPSTAQSRFRAFFNGAADPRLRTPPRPESRTSKRIATILPALIMPIAPAPGDRALRASVN